MLAQAGLELTLWLSLVSDLSIAEVLTDIWAHEPLRSAFFISFFFCQNKVLGFSCLHFLPKNGDQVNVVMYILL